MKFFQSNKEENKKFILMGLLSSLGVVLYIIVVVTFINNAQRILGKEDNFLTPVIVLILFVLSALITSSLVLGKPIMLYFDGQKKESIKLLAYTAVSLAVILALVILAYLGLR